MNNIKPEDKHWAGCKRTWCFQSYFTTLGGGWKNPGRNAHQRAIVDMNSRNYTGWSPMKPARTTGRPCAMPGYRAMIRKKILCGRWTSRINSVLLMAGLTRSCKTWVPDWITTKKGWNSWSSEFVAGVLAAWCWPTKIACYDLDLIWSFHFAKHSLRK